MKNNTKKGTKNIGKAHTLIADKLLGTEVLGLDTKGQWYDSIKNGGDKIKTPKFFRS